VPAPDITFAQYLPQAQRTANTKLPKHTRIRVMLLGLIGELGEIAELVKKHLGHGHALDRERVIKELGDFAWYVAEAAVLCDAHIAEPGGVLITDADTRIFHTFRRLRTFINDWELSLDVAMPSSMPSSLAPIHLQHLYAIWCDMCAAFGVTREEVLWENIRKLGARYPQGFTEAASQQRKAGDD
jgi:hypothetical protein